MRRRRVVLATGQTVVACGRRWRAAATFPCGFIDRPIRHSRCLAVRGNSIGGPLMRIGSRVATLLAAAALVLTLGPSPAFAQPFFDHGSALRFQVTPENAE